MGAGVPGFPANQQGAIGVPYPPPQTPLDSRLSHSPHGGRTPGRGIFRTPFSHNPQPRSTRTQSPGMSQHTSDSSLPSQVSVSADRSAESASAGVVTDLEALSLADGLGGRRLSPIVTHAVLSPSDIILASAARSHASQLTTAAAAQMTQPFLSGSVPLQSDMQQSDPTVIPATLTAVVGSKKVLQG